MDHDYQLTRIVAILDMLSRILSERSRRKRQKFWEKELADAARMCDSRREQTAREQLARS